MSEVYFIGRLNNYCGLALNSGLTYVTKTDKCEKISELNEVKKLCCL